jgi:branched-chain amino acid transport system substrate-binding protein
VAIANANSENVVPRVKFKLDPLDDQATPSIGQQNAAKFVSDSNVVGVVGPYNSSVAESLESTLNAANLVDVSPANTNPALTQGPNFTKSKVRQYKSYFRTIPTDSVESAAVADYTYDKLGIRKVALVDDATTYGVGVTSIFQTRFTALGGKIVYTGQVSTSSSDYSAIVTAIKNSGAQAVDFGGIYSQAGPLKRQLEQAGVKIPLVANDAVYDAQYLSLAGSAAADGSYVVTAGEPISSSEGTPQANFISDYQKNGYNQPYGIFGPYSYDATWAIIEAVKAAYASDGNKPPTRSDVEAATQNVSFTGLTGQVSFDSFGDATSFVIVMNTVKNGQWTALGTVSTAGA